MLAEFPRVRNTNITDPEQALRLELLATDRILERVYQGERVDLDTITQPGVKGRVEAVLLPISLGDRVLFRVLFRDPVNLHMLQKNYPDAYGLYSIGLDRALRRAAYTKECEQRAKQSVFCAVNN
jgi:hypothetical protein